MSLTLPPVVPPEYASARARMGEAAAWRALAHGGDPAEFANAWLRLLAAQLDLALAAPGQERAVLGGFVALRQGQSQRFGRVARLGGAEPGAALAQAGERSLQLRRAVAFGAEPGSATAQLAAPVLLGESLEGVVALELAPLPGPALDTALRFVQWGLAWYVASHKPTGAAASLAVRATTMLGKPGPGIVALQLTCTLLAEATAAQRVSLGVGAPGRIRLLATSRGSLADAPTDFAIALRAAMAEAVAAAAPLGFPSVEAQPGATGGQQRLAHSHGADWVLSVPVAPTEPGDPWLVLTVEGAGEAPADAAETWGSEFAALAPQLRLRLLAGHSMVEHALHALAGTWQRWTQGRPYGRWATGAALLAVMLFLGFAKGDHRVAARATLEGEVKRAIVAPFDGYLAEAMVRPGMRVPAGTVLARLEDRELRLQRADYQGRIAEAQFQMDDAIGKRDLSAANLAAARRAQAEAELRLIQDNLGRTVLVAPFDAIVISGDPTQTIGAPLHRGDVVYELSPMDRFRVALEVDQTDFGFIHPGQSGGLLLTPLPDLRWPIQVTVPTPVASGRDGRTAFRVEAALDAQDPALRPGMQGVAKVVVGRARYVWIWTHEVTAWARLKLWEYLP